MSVNSQTEFWSHIGSQKDFSDPFFVEKFEEHLKRDDSIIEYGCGYGRILNMLDKLGFKSLLGFDIAVGMIERGRREFPQLDLRPLAEGSPLPVEAFSAAGVIVSTVLCCNHELKVQRHIIDEAYRVLRVGGVIYVADFLISESARFLEKYSKNGLVGEDYGVYRTSEGAVVRHHTTTWINSLLHKFDMKWYKEFDHETMNGNQVKTFHAILSKPAGQ